MATLSETLIDYIAGAFSGIWLQTYEPQEAIREIGQLCREQGWTLRAWNIDQGLLVGGQDTTENEAAGDPLAAIKAAGALAAADQTSIVALENFHRFISSVEIVQALVNQLHAGKHNRSFLIVLAPVLIVPLVLVWAWILTLSGYVGLATMTAGVSAPVLVAVTRSGDQPLLIFCALLALLMIFTHRSNIQRMRDGTETRNARLMLFRKNGQ